MRLRGLVNLWKFGEHTAKNLERYIPWDAQCGVLQYTIIEIPRFKENICGLSQGMVGIEKDSSFLNRFEIDFLVYFLCSRDVLRSSLAFFLSSKFKTESGI